MLSKYNVTLRHWQILGKVAKLFEILDPNLATPFMKEHSKNHDSANIAANPELTRNATQPDWKEIRRFVAQEISDLSATKIESIGAFYTLIALRFAFVESCFQEQRGTTIFKG